MTASKKLEGEIKGDTRKKTYFLAEYEDRLIDKLAPLVPSYIQTYHLTLSAIPAALLTILFGYWAFSDKIWLIGIALMLEIHFLTDMLDGEIGRRRDTGLVKWGFYTDHFLDLVFASALMVAFALAFPHLKFLHFAIYTSISLFFVESMVMAIVYDTYSTSGFLGKVGITEITQVAAAATISFIFLQQNIIDMLFWISAAGAIVAAFIQAYFNSKKLWTKDMEIKDRGTVS